MLKKLVMCRRCYAFHYKKSWSFEMPKYLSGHRDEEVPVLFSQCPACLEEENSFYEKEENFVFR